MLYFKRLTKFIVFLLLILSISLGAPAAEKPKPGSTLKDHDMYFALVRSAVPGCEPLCPEWIVAEGTITATTAKEFESFYKDSGSPIVPIVLTSPGGDLRAALAMGNFIHQRGLDVMVGRTLLANCGPNMGSCPLKQTTATLQYGRTLPQIGYCASACPFILAGGKHRYLTPPSLIGLHRITITSFSKHKDDREVYRVTPDGKKIVRHETVSRQIPNSWVSTQLSPHLVEQLSAYLKDMNVKPTILTLLNLASPRSLYTLSAPELKDTNIITDFNPPQLITDNSRCKGSIAAGNCIFRKP